MDFALSLSPSLTQLLFGTVQVHGSFHRCPCYAPVTDPAYQDFGDGDFCSVHLTFGQVMVCDVVAVTGICSMAGGMRGKVFNADGYLGVLRCA